MAQSFSFIEGGNITSEDVKKCSEKLSNVLDTSPARHKFRIHLELEELKYKQALLEFCEKCNTFLLKAKESNHHTQGWSQRYLEPEVWQENFFILFPISCYLQCGSQIL
jgi:hypothetical protein